MLEAGETVEHCRFHCFGDPWGTAGSEDRNSSGARITHCLWSSGGAGPGVMESRLYSVLWHTFPSWAWATFDLGHQKFKQLDLLFGKAMGKGKYGIFDQQDINQQGIKIITCKWCFHRITWWFCNYMQVVFCLVLLICYEFIKNPCQSFSWLCLSDEWYLFRVTNGCE